MARGRIMTTDEFISKSIEKHGDKFNYSLVKFINTKTKVILICKYHGEFLQNPNNHLNGQGCFKCSNDHKRDCLERFVYKSNLIHGNKYDYSFTNYINSRTNVNIICPEHGNFKQIPNAHLNGNGCPGCCNSLKIDTDEFIKRAKLKHSNKYDYSSTVYINSKTNIIITCKEHGDFIQVPSNHLCGNGCPKCGSLYGVKENKWLDSLLVKERQFRIGKYVVDGYDPIKNTIYEFNGDFWHGNPKIYNSDNINNISGKSFGYLYDKTLIKENYLKSLGYNIISIWESDFTQGKY